MLLSVIRKNKNLEAKRNPAFDTNRFAKFMIYFMVAYWAAILLLLGVLLPPLFEEVSPAMEPYHIMNQGLIYILLADFLLRTMAQPAISNEVKPYLLLPVKKKKLISTFLLQHGISSYNFFWFFMFVPFAFITIIKFYGFGGMFLYLLGIWLLMVMNTYWFSLCKMLFNEHPLWILLPILFYLGLGAAEFLLKSHPISIFTMNFAEGYILGNILTFILTIAAILLLFWINYVVQKKILYDEISKVKDTKIKHVSEYKFLDRYGLVGEYMRLELKLVLRNKTAKTQFFMGFFIMIAFSCALAFTDVYDGEAMQAFLFIYNFCILGLMTLGNTMSFEGNYIDGLMSRKESIYILLRAKYYIALLFLLIPFAVMMLPVTQDKVSILAPFAYMMLSGGFIFALLLQTAVYNSRTLPLNANITKGNRSTSKMQQLISAGAFGLPIMLDTLLALPFGRMAAYWIEFTIGLAFIITHRYWIKNIYKRLMKRKYKNMESFRATR